MRADRIFRGSDDRGKKKRRSRATSLRERLWNNLRSRAVRLHDGRVGRQTMGSDEEIVVVQIAVDASGNFRRLRTESGASALQEDDDHHASNAGVGIGGEPTEARSRVRAGSRLAQNGFFVEI